MTTVKRNGKFVTEREVSPEELFQEETEVEENHYTDIWSQGYDVMVAPTTDDAMWRINELVSVHNSPWYVRNVTEGHNGPEILFRRE